MCFIEKMNCIWIRKREDRAPDPVRPPSQVGYGGASPSQRFLGLVTSELLNLQRRISFVFRGFCHLHCLMGLKLIPNFSLFACRMARGHEETSTSQAGCKGKLPL